MVLNFFVGVHLTVYKLGLISDCRVGTLYCLDSCLVFRKSLSVKVFLGKLNFSLGSFLSSCKVYSVRVVLVSGLIMLYEGFNYGMSN